MELDQRMSFVEEVVVVDCRKFVVPILVPHSCPVKQRKVLLVAGYMRFVEQLLGPHKSPVELTLLVDCKMLVERMLVPHSCLVELMVVDCKMFVELLRVLHMNLVELRKQMLVVSCKMSVELHRSLVEQGGGQMLEDNHYKMVALLLAAPCKLVFAVVSFLDWKVSADVQVD